MIEKKHEEGFESLLKYSENVKGRKPSSITYFKWK